MKKTFRLLTITATVLALMPGCNKVQDILEKDPTADIRLCNITRIYAPAQGENTYLETDATFLYNSIGNPVSVTVSKPGTGNPHKLFRYDAKQRLVEFIEPYDDPNQVINDLKNGERFRFERFVKYSYADK